MQQGLRTLALFGMQGARIGHHAAFGLAVTGLAKQGECSVVEWARLIGAALFAAQVAHTRQNPPLQATVAQRAGIAACLIEGSRRFVHAAVAPQGQGRVEPVIARNAVPMPGRPSTCAPS